MMQRWRPVRDERGQGVAVLIVVLLVVLVTVGFLTRTLLLGLSINDKAEKIARTGRGINTATDAILQLDRTEGFGRTIHESTEPLEGKSNIIVGQAASIDNTASSINSSAESINSSVSGIGSAVASVQSLARLAEGDARNININVRTVIETANAIHGRDLDDVIRALARTENNAATIAGAIGGLDVTP